jgi:hypothetical protein
MTKYRIKEVDGTFIPQVKEFLWWKDLVRGVYHDKESALGIIKFDYNFWNQSTPSYHYVSEEELND